MLSSQGRSSISKEFHLGAITLWMILLFIMPIISSKMILVFCNDNTKLFSCISERIRFIPLTDFNGTLDILLNFWERIESELKL